jgi:ribonuclease P protein component
MSATTPKKPKRSLVRSLSAFSKKEIEAAFEQARPVLKRAYCTLLVAPKAKEFARILVVTPKKIGTAPQRNKLKRQLKAIFYEQELYQGPNDCLVILKNGAPALSFDDLKMMLSKLPTG